jgi:hypothetical protein
MCSTCYESNQCTLKANVRCNCGDHIQLKRCITLRTLTDAERVPYDICSDVECNAIYACARFNCVTKMPVSMRSITPGDRKPALCAACKKTHVKCDNCSRVGKYNLCSAYFHPKLLAVNDEYAMVTCTMCILPHTHYSHAVTLLHVRMARDVITRRIMHKPWDLAIVLLNWNSYTARERDSMLTDDVFREKSHRLFPLLDTERMGELMYRCAFLPRDVFELVLSLLLLKT